MSVTLLRLQSGEIAFFYLHKNSSSDLEAYVKLSRDEAKSWGAPVCVTPVDRYHVMNNDRVIQLKSGRLLAPVASSPDFRKLDHWVSSVHYSDDLGKTWRKSNSEIDLPKRGAMEPGLVELRDGSVMMIIRTQMGSVYRSLSRDGGVTWTAGETMGLVAPVAPATISRIPKTGDLLIVWNNAPDKRTPLTTAVSKDEASLGKAFKIWNALLVSPMPTPYSLRWRLGSSILLGASAHPRRTFDFHEDRRNGSRLVLSMKRSHSF